MPPQLMMMIMQMMQQGMKGAGSLGANALTNPGKPYGDAEREYDRYTQPWSQGGANARNAFTDRLGQMGDTQGFYNNMMSGYQESPYARTQQQQGVRAGNAMGSASGLSGSTPLANYMQQNAQNISTQDQDKYYQNMMGINKDYMQGQDQMMNYGYGSDMASAPFHADQAYNKQRAQDDKQSQMIQSLLKMFGWA